MRLNLRKYDKRFKIPGSIERKSAYKAWRTIRNNKRVNAAKDTPDIIRYATPAQMASVVHPEEVRTKETIEQVSFGKGIVTLFHKTPADIACGRFWEVRWAYGCPLDCNYCYLRGTMRGRMKPSPIQTQYVLRAIDEAFQNIREPSIFNTGELSDSLMYPSLMEKIVDKFEEQAIHKVALLSKMGVRNIDFLLKGLRRQTICAWSINSDVVARRWEKAAPEPDERIRAAKLVSDMGYDTRIRIDPIFPVANWKSQYEDLLYGLLSAFEPKRIILGTPRGLWKTIKYARDAKIDMSWTNFFAEDTSWGKKIAFRQRQEIYDFFVNKLESLGYSRSNVTICKETTGMLQSLGIPFSPLTCNCYGPQAFKTNEVPS
ncbi:MAG TPA: radical SAM protein [Nitrososphaera sp.]|jgi:DNA repair photolyase|nr:radical SAM protein [Nitrososphaera sp.]